MTISISGLGQRGIYFSPDEPISRRDYSNNIDGLITDLQKGDDTIHREAKTALVKLGEKAVPALIDIVKENRAPSDSIAAEILGRIGKKADEAVPELIEALKKSDDPLFQDCAAKALGRILKGTADKEARLALLNVLKKSNDENVRYSVLDALRIIKK